MFEQGISKEARKHLALLKVVPLPVKFYLAGGTACALHLGHRLSYDLDFFSDKSFDTKKVLNALKPHGKFALTQEAENTLGGEWNGVRVSFFAYTYPRLDRFSEFEGVEVAGLRDLGCMKLSAIMSRGTKRDFVDLFFILREITLNELVESFKRKYAGVGYSLSHLCKSISYFDDAEDDEMPKMITDIAWPEMKQFLEEKAAGLL